MLGELIGTVQGSDWEVRGKADIGHRIRYRYPIDKEQGTKGQNGVSPTTSKREEWRGLLPSPFFAWKPATRKPKTAAYKPVWLQDL